VSSQSRTKVTSIGRPQSPPTMRGYIKWYSQEKRYGFAVDENGVEHYFNSNDVIAVANPGAGIAIEFSPRVNQKGPRATLIKEVARPTVNRSQSVEKSDSRVKCGSCEKLMVPRLILGPPLAASSHWTPVPKKSVCPFCGCTHQEFPPSPEERTRELWQIAFVIFVLLIVMAAFH